MACCEIPIAAQDCDGAFTVDASRVTFGRGCLAEVGDRAGALGLRRVALFSDPKVAALPIFATTHDSLVAAGIDVVTFSDVHFEPTDASFQEGARFAQEVGPDGYVSLGGGSVIDTCKAANLYTTYPADLLTYVNAPIGESKPVPGPLKPHIACPTTAGTGSEVTGIAIFDLVSLSAKTGIASHALRPTGALVAPHGRARPPLLHRESPPRGRRLGRARCAVARFGVLHRSALRPAARSRTPQPAAHESGCQSVERSGLPGGVAPAGAVFGASGERRFRQ